MTWCVLYLDNDPNGEDHEEEDPTYYGPDLLRPLPKEFATQLHRCVARTQQHPYDACAQHQGCMSMGVSALRARSNAHTDAHTGIHAEGTFWWGRGATWGDI